LRQGEDIGGVFYYTPSAGALRLITQVHRALYRATLGLVGASLLQLEETRGRLGLRVLTVLLLTTTGRKSGAARTVPLPCFLYEGRTFLVASFAGLDRHPAWYCNLAENPEVEVQLRSRRRRCRAVTLAGTERARFWQKIIEDWPRYRLYQERTRREIPVVELLAG
jgi:deazaflavin-dependent oxidoreductase (nitroreductase family)